jgi:hypothetical protein
MAVSAAGTAPVTADITITPNSWVLISGLKTDLRLNGACGKVLKEVDPTNGKYTVRAILSAERHKDVIIRAASIAPVPASDMIETVRIACDGERTKFLQTLLFPKQHPMFLVPGNAPVPALLGMPLTVQQVSPVTPLGGRADYDNRFATFLMVDPVTGFAPPEWQSYVGPVHVWRPGGGENLTVRDVDVLYDYIYGTLMDLYSERALKPAQHLVPAALRRARLQRFPDERARGTGPAQAPAASSAAPLTSMSSPLAGLGTPPARGATAATSVPVASAPATAGAGSSSAASAPATAKSIASGEPLAAASTAPTGTCTAAGCSAAATCRCSACHAPYCSAACQGAAWATHKAACRPAAAALFARLLTAPATDGDSAFEIATRFEKGAAAGAPAKDASKAIDFYWRALEAGNKKATPRLKELFRSLAVGHYPSLLPFADKASWADVRNSSELPEDLRELVEELQAHTDALAEEPFRGDVASMRATAIALDMPNRTAYLRFLTPANVERMRLLYYHPYDRAVARRVGQELYAAGGSEAMSAVYYLFMWTSPYATASRRAGTLAAELDEQANALAKVNRAAAKSVAQQAAAYRLREMALLGYPKDVQRMWDGIGDWRD